MSGEPILIVDDNPINLKLERVLLEVEDYLVQTAQNAEEALEALKTFHPLLILMDVQLPGMDGMELTRKLKEDPQYQNVRIVMVTSYSQKGDEKRARQAGCDIYICKPIDTQTLPVIVGNYLRKPTSGDSKTTF